MDNTTTPLARWLKKCEHGAAADLARKLEITPNHLSDIRRGVKVPSYRLMCAIEHETLAIERRSGVKAPRGVTVDDWSYLAARSSPPKRGARKAKAVFRTT